LPGVGPPGIIGMPGRILRPTFPLASFMPRRPMPRPRIRPPFPGIMPRGTGRIAGPLGDAECMGG
jgi:hypothetical protein